MRMAEGGADSTHLCSICFEEFDTPKVLSCGHTFCLSCVKKIVPRRRRDGSRPALKCPICRTDVSFPESGKAEDLATNFQLVSILNHQRLDLEYNARNRCRFHGIRTQFYCVSCKDPACLNCLLRKHNVSRHKIIRRKDYLRKQQSKVYKLEKRLLDIRGSYDRLVDRVVRSEEVYLRDKGEMEEIKVTLEEKQEELPGEAAYWLQLITEFLNFAESSFSNFDLMRTSMGATLDELSGDLQMAKGGPNEAVPAIDDNVFDEFTEKMYHIEKELKDKVTSCTTLSNGVSNITSIACSIWTWIHSSTNSSPQRRPQQRQRTPSEMGSWEWIP